MRTLIPVLAALLLSPAFAADKKPALVTAGSFKRIKKSEFFELSYREAVKGKKKAKSRKAYVRIGEGTQFMADRTIPVTALAKDAKVWLYGNPVESSSVTESGQTVVDRQIRSCLVIAAGESLEIAAGKQDKGARWLEATVSKPGKALYVTYDGSSYKVLLSRGCAVFTRQALKKAPKLKKKILARVTGTKTDALPTKPKKNMQGYSAVQVVILHKRLRAAYALVSRR
jgi:bifunctional DNA-binding transcriptional regulator/antitoxin component of YhaV-PrlF toxin-antitoxin module